jgi:hypothetical protein
LVSLSIHLEVAGCIVKSALKARIAYSRDFVVSISIRLGGWIYREERS